MGLSEEYLVNVTHLRKHFASPGGFLRKVSYVRAVDDVSFGIRDGETFGLVGESGCGKTTVGRLLLRLLEPTSGEVTFDGLPLYSLEKEECRKLRRKMQLIFQDPYGSLNPRMTIRDIILEPLEVHDYPEKDREDRVMGLLEQVGLEGAYAERYPHQLSGGQHQRVVIARALALNPKFIVCDEPVSALDVSIQSQLLNLLEDLQKKLGLTYLFIAHNLSVVKHASHRIGVMYLGKMLELAGEREICENPLHPYTRALLAAVPVPDPDASRELVVLEGEIPNAINPPSGCRFHPRCAAAREECKVLEPEWKEVSTGIGLLVIFVMSCRYRCRCGTWYLL
ncbi:MAG: ABC transporter ATP-binding protein [Bacillota bacterium]|jgi:oligopeptide transport system ATP-binding protein